MGFNEYKDIIIGFLASGGVGFLCFEIRELSHSVQELNLKLATILAKSEFHEEKLTEHQRRIERLEGN